MTTHQTDEEVLAQIQTLENEEQALYAGRGGTADVQLRADQIRVELDRLWDLLRQRRALREFGKNPDQAKLRPAEVVEKYEQ